MPDGKLSGRAAIAITELFRQPDPCRGGRVAAVQLRGEYLYVAEGKGGIPRSA